MAAVYKPTEAIQLLRPISKRPPSIPRRPLARAAFSTSRPALASPSSTPPPQPTRRSVTVTNDTGAVRWSDLSPGEKASRTVQQSMNLSVVLVGIAMTVRFPPPPPAPTKTLTIFSSAASPTSSSPTSSRPPPKPHTSTARRPPSAPTPSANACLVPARKSAHTAKLRGRVWRATASSRRPRRRTSGAPST